MSATPAKAELSFVPNVASGGKQSDVELDTFLGQSGNPPEQQALLRLIAVLTRSSVNSGSGGFPTLAAIATRLDGAGRVLLRRRTRREGVIALAAKLPGCVSR